MELFQTKLKVFFNLPFKIRSAYLRINKFMILFLFFSLFFFSLISFGYCLKSSSIRNQRE